MCVRKNVCYKITLFHCICLAATACREKWKIYFVKTVVIFIDNIAMRLMSTDGIESQYVAIVERMLDDGVANISHVLVLYAFTIYLQEEFCVDMRNIISSLLESNVLLWIPQHAVKLENCDLIEKFHAYDWLNYGALMLKRIVYKSTAEVKNKYNFHILKHYLKILMNIELSKTYFNSRLLH